MNLNIVKNHDEQVNKIVESLSQIITGLLNNQEMVVLAVSGGKSPIALFHKLSNVELAWDKIIITLVDERVIDNEDSNELLVKTNLLINKAQNARFIGLFNNATGTNLLENLEEDVPTIDIAILGMGEDGHTASIFPNCAELKDALDLTNSYKYMVLHPTTAKYSRISLTLKSIVNIKHLFLSINGELKLNVFKEAIKGKNLNYPISYVFSLRDDVHVYWYE